MCNKFNSAQAWTASFSESVWFSHHLYKLFLNQLQSGYKLYNYKRLVDCNFLEQF